MNNRTLDYLLFHDAGQRWVFHDKTVQMFFAARWAMTHGSDQDRQNMQRWIVGKDGESLGGFDEFWQFAAELPDPLIEPARWHSVFAPCYTPPDQLRGEHDFVHWHRSMVYHSFERMRRRDPDTIARWRQRALDLEAGRGDASQKRILDELRAGFRLCPLDPVADRQPFWMGSPDSEQGRFDHEALRHIVVEPFLMHEFPVTNAQTKYSIPATSGSRNHRTTANRWLT